MDTLTAIIIISCGYFILLFFDLFFKSCAHYPYLQLLDGLGIRISFFSIKWKTKALNRLLIKWGNTRPLIWRVWFGLGAFTSLSLFPIALYILFSSILDSLFTSESDHTPLLTVVIPGLNLPISELGYYSVTLLICSIVHELGHAFAAVVEDIGILDFGCNMYFILPVAFVSLPTDKIMSLTLKKRLSIFTAGVWHNIFLSFIAFLLYCSLPSIFSPFYDYGNGVSVSKISKNSPLKDSSKGLFVDDVIVAINSCPIKDETDWYGCLNNRDILLPAVCIKSDLVNTLDESIPLKHLGSGYVECCDSKTKTNLCFEYIDIENNELELPGHVCLPVRTVMEQSSSFCTVSPHSCPNDLYCFKPVLPNDTYLFKIASKTKHVFYLGHPNDLFQTIEVSPFVRKTTLFSVTFPNGTMKLLKYITIISLGLAFVNILPLVFMDGEFILQTIAHIIFKNKAHNRKIVKIANVITWMSTLILVIYLIYSLTLIL